MSTHAADVRETCLRLLDNAYWDQKDKRTIVADIVKEIERSTQKAMASQSSYDWDDLFSLSLLINEGFGRYTPIKLQEYLKEQNQLIHNLYIGNFRIKSRSKDYYTWLEQLALNDQFSFDEVFKELEDSGQRERAVNFILNFSIKFNAEIKVFPAAVDLFIHHWGYENINSFIKLLTFVTRHDVLLSAPDVLTLKGALRRMQETIEKHPQQTLERMFYKGLFKILVAPLGQDGRAEFAIGFDQATHLLQELMMTPSAAKSYWFVTHYESLLKFYDLTSKFRTAECWGVLDFMLSLSPSGFDALSLDRKDQRSFILLAVLSLQKTQEILDFFEQIEFFNFEHHLESLDDLKFYYFLLETLKVKKQDQVLQKIQHSIHDYQLKTHNDHRVLDTIEGLIESYFKTQKWSPENILKGPVFESEWRVELEERAQWINSRIQKFENIKSEFHERSLVDYSLLAQIKEELNQSSQQEILKNEENDYLYKILVLLNHKNYDLFFRYIKKQSRFDDRALAYAIYWDEVVVH